jgi:curved DNA-binding protein CbpA
MNLHELLGVPEDATDHEIRAAYRRIALRCHPDRTKGDPAAESLFHEATEAYRILTHPERRRRYEVEYGLVESIVDLFERRRIGRRLLKAVLPTAKNAPRSGRSWIQAVPVPERGREADGTFKAHPPHGGGRRPLRIGKPPDGQAVSWYEIEGHGEPGRNGGEPGDFWLMIIDRRGKDGA